MEKDKKITIVTKQAQKTINKNKIKIKTNIIYDKKSINKLTNNKQQVRVYDITYINTRKQIINVNDHINKTGENPLRGKQKKLKVDFIDITKIYQQTKKGIITTCVGKNKTKEEFIKTQNASTELCEITILCCALGFKKIEAKLINCFDLF